MLLTFTKRMACCNAAQNLLALHSIAPHQKLQKNTYKIMQRDIFRTSLRRDFPKSQTQREYCIQTYKGEVTRIRIVVMDY